MRERLRMLRQISGSLLAFGFSVAGLLAETEILNPDELKPRHILDDFTIEAPSYIDEILRNSNIGYRVGVIGSKRFVLFRERKPCPDYGCIVVVFTSINQRLIEPIMFFSKSEAFILENEQRGRDGDGELCVVRNQLSIC